MKFWEIVRTDLDLNGCVYGHTVLKYSANKEKVDEFVKNWEDMWAENTKNHNDEVGLCWMDCEGKLKVFEHELED